MTLNQPTTPALQLEEQDLRTKDSLEGNFKDSENKGLIGTPEVLNPSPEGFTNIQLPQFQTSNIPCQAHSALPTNPPPPPPPPTNFPPSFPYTILALVTMNAPPVSTG